MTMNLDLDDTLSMNEKEIINDYYQLATLVCLLTGKKLTLQNVFIAILEDQRINRIAKYFLEVNSDVEICKNLLMLDPALVKSKVIMTFAADRVKQRLDNAD